MQALARVVSINGSPRRVSRTDTLVRAIAQAVVAATGASSRHFAMTQIAPQLMTALMRDDLDRAGEAIIAEIERADILVIGTPVYRAGYTGLLKHVFDLVDRHALHGRVAILAATGGNRQHGLVLEHQLRPLASFFGMFTVPSTIYAEESDFDGIEIGNPAIHARIDCIAGEVNRLMPQAAQRIAESAAAH